MLFFSFFFFQAEDGIRDLTVTGVQTCALPILYVFNGAAGQRVTLDSISASASEAQWFLYSPSDQNLVSGNILTDLGEKVLPTTGTYCLVVQGTGISASPLSYQVKLTDALDPPVAVSG